MGSHTEPPRLLEMVTNIEGTNIKIVAALLLLVYEHNCWCFLASKGTYNLLCAVAIFVVVNFKTTLGSTKNTKPAH